MVKAAFLTVLATALAWAGPALAKRAPTPYTVAKVSVVADAKNAVVAKQNALAMAQQDALRILLKRMTHWRAHGRLPVLEHAMVDRMINGFSVRRESNSATRYMATLDFDFEPHAVRDLLNRFGLPYIDQQAPLVLLLPVLLEAGGLKRGTKNPWYAALAAVDSEHALTPVKLAPPRQDFSPSVIENLSKHSRELFETLKYQYRAENLVLAAAEVDAQATQLQVRLVGHDAVGSFTLSRTYRVYDRDLDEAAAMAAEVSMKIIEGRWKTTRLASLGALAEPVPVETVTLTAQFSGLREWREMRTRLQRVPGVQAIDIKALNARAAELSLDYPGGAGGLAQAAPSQGLAVEQRGREWVLVTR